MGDGEGRGRRRTDRRKEAREHTAPRPPPTRSFVSAHARVSFVRSFDATAPIDSTCRRTNYECSQAPGSLLNMEVGRGPTTHTCRDWREMGSHFKVLAEMFQFSCAESEKGTAFDAVRMNERRERDRGGERGTIEASERANERATMMGLSGRTSERTRGEREREGSERLSHATKRTNGRTERGVGAAERR